MILSVSGQPERRQNSAYSPSELKLLGALAAPESFNEVDSTVARKVFCPEMALPKAVSMTAEEFFTLPEGPPYYELIDGELIMSPSPQFFHQAIALNIATPLKQYLSQNRIGTVCIAPLDVRLDDRNVVEPDVFFISRQRENIIGERITGAPEFVVEILSPGTSKRDRETKRQLYAASQVQEYWIVDPENETVSGYYLQEEAEFPKFMKFGGEQFISPLFPRLVFKVDEIFAK